MSLHAPLMDGKSQHMTCHDNWGQWYSRVSNVAL
jgi:hypothetical protein